eukprot:07052_1
MKSTMMIRISSLFKLRVQQVLKTPTQTLLWGNLSSFHLLSEPFLSKILGMWMLSLNRLLSSMKNGNKIIHRSISQHMIGAPR